MNDAALCGSTLNHDHILTQLSTLVSAFNLIADIVLLTKPAGIVVTVIFIIMTIIFPEIKTACTDRQREREVFSRTVVLGGFWIYALLIWHTFWSMWWCGCFISRVPSRLATRHLPISHFLERINTLQAPEHLQEIVWRAAGHMGLSPARGGVKLQAGTHRQETVTGSSWHI